MLPWRTNPRLGHPAFTLIEMLIVLSILIGISAIVLPSMLTRGIDDQRADLELRLGAALLDAQREARRIGATIEVRWVQVQGSSESNIMIQTMTNTSNQSGDDPAGWSDSSDALNPEDFLPGGADSESSEDSADSMTREIESDDGLIETTLAYVLPDGTLIAGEGGTVVEINQTQYSLTIEPASLSATLSIYIDSDSEVSAEQPSLTEGLEP